MVKRVQDYTLDEIVSNNDTRQYFLTNNHQNISRVEQKLKDMGMGDRFECVGSGDKALVIAPTFTSEIVIRLSTEYEEPGFIQYDPLKGRDVNVHRPYIPQVLQSLHTELLPVAPSTMTDGHTPLSPSTKMRIEILPRLKIAEVNNAGAKYGTILGRELSGSGYNISDPKPQNIGLLPNQQRTPVIVDPGEITWVGKSSLSRALSAIKRHAGGYRWSFAAQTEHLKTNWKAYIMKNIERAKELVEVGTQDSRFQSRLDQSPEISGKFR